MRRLAGFLKKPAVERGMNFPQFDDRRFKTALLLLEQFDLFHALLAREMQGFAVCLAQKMFDLSESKAQPPGCENHIETLAVAQPV